MVVKNIENYIFSKLVSVVSFPFFEAPNKVVPENLCSLIFRIWKVASILQEKRQKCSREWLTSLINSYLWNFDLIGTSCCHMAGKHLRLRPEAQQVWKLMYWRIHSSCLHFPKVLKIWKWEFEQITRRRINFKMQGNSFIRK